MKLSAFFSGFWGHNNPSSALITNKAKEIIVDSKNEEMTLNNYSKYEALYPPTDDEESSDS